MSENKIIDNLKFQLQKQVFDLKHQQFLLETQTRNIIDLKKDIQYTEKSIEILERARNEAMDSEQPSL